MMLIAYPKEIEKLMKIWRPYGKDLYLGKKKDIPKEAINAYEKCKRWAWEQGQ